MNLSLKVPVKVSCPYIVQNVFRYSKIGSLHKVFIATAITLINKLRSSLKVPL